MFAIVLFSIFHFRKHLAATQFVHMQVTLGPETIHPAASYRRQLKLTWTDTQKNIGSE